MIPNRESQTQTILAFLENHTAMVVSTVNEHSMPEAAVVRYAERQNLELIFETFTNSRKYGNLRRHPMVACTIWDENTTVQYQGLAQELEADERDIYANSYVSKVPLSRKFLETEGVRFFKVSPTWIRYTNVSTQPWTTFECNF